MVHTAMLHVRVLEIPENLTSACSKPYSKDRTLYAIMFCLLSDMGLKGVRIRTLFWVKKYNHHAIDRQVEQCLLRRIFVVCEFRQYGKNSNFKFKFFQFRLLCLQCMR